MRGGNKRHLWDRIYQLKTLFFFSKTFLHHGVQCWTKFLHFEIKNQYLLNSRLGNLSSNPTLPFSFFPPPVLISLILNLNSGEGGKGRKWDRHPPTLLFPFFAKHAISQHRTTIRHFLYLRTAISTPSLLPLFLFSPPSLSSQFASVIKWITPRKSGTRYENSPISLRKFTKSPLTVTMLA